MIIPLPVSEAEPARGLESGPKVSRSLDHSTDFRSGDLLLHALCAVLLMGVGERLGGEGAFLNLAYKPFAMFVIL